MEKFNKNTEEMSKIAVLIPCYNESKTIAKVIHDYREALPDADIYVYDNNSDDGTDEIAREAGAIVRYETRQGKGNVIRSMFHQIDADCYLMIDGDDTYPASDAPKMCKLVQEGIDMVVGTRLNTTYFKENKRPFHNSGNRLVRMLVNKIFDSHVADIMTGYRAFSKDFVKTFPCLSRGFEVETEMTIHALDKNMLLKEIPVTYRDRLDGSVSKLNTFSDGIKVIMTVFQLFRDYRPLLFFSIIAAVIFILALILFAPVFIEYLQTGLVPRFPTLIVSSFMVLMAMMMWSCGIILEVVVKKHRQLFELLRNK
jgi:glycosyltransferase involved in cell wall biosynthesis